MDSAQNQLLDEILSYLDTVDPKDLQEAPSLDFTSIRNCVTELERVLAPTTAPKILIEG